MFKKILTACICTFGILPLAHAIDLGNESMADKADRFDFEEFHKEKGIPLWEDKKEKVVTEKMTEPAKASSFDKGQVLKVREPYKLGNDPALRSTQSLFEAMEALHKQLNGYCPRGWIKDREWYQPEEGHWYLYHEAVCL